MSHNVSLYNVHVTWQQCPPGENCVHLGKTIPTRHNVPFTTSRDNSFHLGKTIAHSPQCPTVQVMWQQCPPGENYSQCATMSYLLYYPCAKVSKISPIANSWDQREREEILDSFHREEKLCNNDFRSLSLSECTNWQSLRICCNCRHHRYLRICKHFACYEAGVGEADIILAPAPRLRICSFV